MTALNSKRSQASMEYLMTYSWALLIIMVVGVVLWQLGIFSAGKTIAPGKSGFTDVTLLDWQAKTDDSVKLILSNRAETRQELNRVDVEVKAGGSGTCNVNLGSEDVSPGGIYEVDLNPCGITNPTGDYYRIEVEIEYTHPGSGITHTSVGDAWGAIE